MIKDMAFAAYSVRDVPAAITFYGDVMGLTPGMAIGEHWVEFTDIYDNPNCRSAFVTDPEGNRFGIHQAKP